MRKSRRQIVNRIAEAAGLGLVVLNLLLFFAIYRPLGRDMAAESHRHAELREQVRNQQIRLGVLEKYAAALPAAGKGLDDFMSQRTPSRREGYSTAAHMINKAANAAGVKVSTLAFRLDTEHHDPLERLTVEMNVQGSYPGLMKFAHALETAKEFMLVREFNLGPGADNGALGLRLGADLYLTP